MPKEINKRWPLPPHEVVSAEEYAAERVRKFILSLEGRISSEKTSVRKVAAKIGLSNSTISRLASGESWPDIRTITLLELYFNDSLLESAKVDKNLRVEYNQH